ncbi:DUF695 domain-containing protein [Allonocardiopsis opalescens]|uniref:Uncharacterized protein DUF695 n=1 Tax=Allonocardiopsis opalescens TaxID=1144618 RepID=A0A2T0QE20_9ACTN|nr:DUF695 domain-containing protein [Allonocardiopsis opalescens]PRY02120.1 uncharacterized protein DUF695 [Allonocardiopsis opalescens]
MGLFRRRKPAPDASAAIAEFWAWWSARHADVSRALADREPDAAPAHGFAGPLADELTERVHRIHPGLAWEVDPADGGEGHRLVLSPGGDDALRAATERWRRSAPATEGWTFHASRPPAPERLAGALDWDGHELDLSHTRVAVRVNGDRIDGSVYHPDFAFLPEEVRDAIAAHVMALALGEDTAARWLGAVRGAEAPPVDPVPAASLPSVVEQLAGMLGGPWRSGQGRTPLGKSVLVALRFPLRRRDFPVHDLHVTVQVPYAESGRDGLPAGGSAAALEAFRAALEAEAGEDGALVFYQTGNGSQVLRLYCDPASDVVERLEKLASQWSEGRAKVAGFLDPEWRALAPYVK